MPIYIQLKQFNAGLPVRLFILLFCLLTGAVYGQEYSFLPTGKEGQIIRKTNYTLQYSEQDEQAYWVAYLLKPAMLSGLADREDDFRPDPEVKTESAQLNDYKASGYDRGHLAPAADMSFSAQAMSESFFLSNMSPQAPSFNRGIWSKLEQQFRNYTLREGEIYVVTGPVFREIKGRIGASEVTVPGYYYKILYDPEPKPLMIAFLLPNEKGVKPLQEYQVSVDYVESLTGLDFFPSLPDLQEDELEKLIYLMK